MIDRAELARRIDAVGWRAPHEPWHIDTFVDAVLESPVDGCLVECGAFKGSSAAKFSHLAHMLGRRLYVFDSFQGLPNHTERHDWSIFGRDISEVFTPGRWAGTLQEVQATVEQHGVPETVTCIEGWFEDTLPGFTEPVSGAYLDVDLAASTTTCLEHLWPLVTPGGVVVSQDGDFPLVIDAIQQWAETADPRPHMDGLGESKMVTLRKAGR